MDLFSFKYLICNSLIFWKISFTQDFGVCCLKLFFSQPHLFAAFQITFVAGKAYTTSSY